MATSTFHVSLKGEVVPCRATVQACPLAGLEGQAHGSEAEVYAALAQSHSSFRSFTKETREKSHKEENEGVRSLRALIGAREDLNRLSRERVARGGSPDDLPPNLRAAYEDARERVREATNVIKALPWDDADGRPYDDSPITFGTYGWKSGRVRRGYENDLDKLGPEELKAYEDLDRASEEWVSRLSTAEVKALHTYVTDAQSYAESMAASNGFAATTTKSFQYLHTALEKAPRVEKPITVYAGISGPRVNEVREAGDAGTIVMNRVQSTSLNPAMINSFMRPSSWDSEDHTALEIQTDRVASLSLFHLREEMEVLLPPQAYQVGKVESGIEYAYSDGYSYEPADRVYRVRPVESE